MRSSISNCARFGVGLLRPLVDGAPTIGCQDARQWTRYSAWLTCNKLIKGSVIAADAFTNAFLRARVRS
jgi:hypothetical protein